MVPLSSIIPIGTKQFKVWLKKYKSGIIINQILLSKLWYIGQICAAPKYVKNEIERKQYIISPWTEKKYDISGTSPLLGCGLGILDIRNSIKLYKSKMLIGI